MAASIVSSSILADLRQIDGRRAIQELHTDSVGRQYSNLYLATALLDATAQLAINASTLLAQMVAAEIAANIDSVSTIGSLASPTFVYSTVAANVAALRAAYALATRSQVIMMGDFLASLTDGQLQTAFGLTAGQVTTLRTNKLTLAATAAATIRAASGQ